MAYLSLYRKWRPQTFADVVGQEHVVRTLRNALDSGRTAHAYIFAGPRGTGKTSLARLFAKGLNCEQGPTSAWCDTCDNCRRIARGQSVDVIEIDGASNRGIDEIRDVREKVKFAPAEGRCKVYIIDEVHMLTAEAFNALLKVLEEPPAHVVFIFATTEAHRIPATIVSRCQKFDFHPFTPEQIAAQVRRVAEQEGVAIDDGALRLIARHASGGMRDALGALDQCIAYADGTITEPVVAQVLGVAERERLEALARFVAAADLGGALSLIKEVMDAGRDLRQFARDAVQYFRDLMLLKAAPGREGFVLLWGDDLQRAESLARQFDLGALLRIVERLGRCEAEMRWAQAVQLPLEMALIELLRQEPQDQLHALIRRIEALEAKLADLERAAAAAPPAKAAQPLPSGEGDRERPPSAPAWTGPASGEASDEAAAAAAASAPSPAGRRAGRPEEAGAAVEGTAGRVAPSDDDRRTFERIRAGWPRLLEFMRSARLIQQEAFLREGTPGAFQNGVLTVYFSQNHRFHQANIAQEKNKGIVEKAIARVFGLDVRLEAVVGEPPPAERAPEQERGPEKSPAGAEAPADLPPRADREPDGLGRRPAVDAGAMDPDAIDEPILKAALELFGGKITLLEPKEGKAD